MTIAATAPLKPLDPFRDSLGRFLPGNPGGPGNPAARELAELRRRFRARVPETVFHIIVDELVSKCIGGNLQAIKLFFTYFLGAPDKGVEADRVNHHELALAVEGARLWQAAQCLGLEPPPPVEAPPVPEPAGRPEAEWRRGKKKQARAEPPVNVAALAPMFEELVRTIGSEGRIKLAEALAPLAHANGLVPPEWLADSSVQPPRAAEAAPAGDGAAPRR